MKKFPFLVFIGLMSLQAVVFSAAPDYDTRFGTNTRTQPGYFESLAHDWTRGLTNIVSSPLEIPVTIMKYHREDKNPPVIKEGAGLADGIVRAVARCGSGLWDMAVGLLPGNQEGGPVQPETLF